MPPPHVAHSCLWTLFRSRYQVHHRFPCRLVASQLRWRKEALRRSFLHEARQGFTIFTTQHPGSRCGQSPGKARCELPQFHTLAGGAVAKEAEVSVPQLSPSSGGQESGTRVWAGRSPLPGLWAPKLVSSSCCPWPSLAARRTAPISVVTRPSPSAHSTTVSYKVASHPGFGPSRLP